MWPFLVSNRQHCWWKSCRKHYTLWSFAKQNSRNREKPEAYRKKDINEKVPMRGWCLWPSLLTNRQHCRRKMVKSITNHGVFIIRIHEIARSKLWERCARKNLRCEDRIVTIFSDQQTTLLMNKVVKSIKGIKASQNRNHEVTRSELWERCQREKTCDAKIRLWPLLMTNRQHCRWKSRKKHYTLRSFAKQKSRSC